MLLIKGYMAAGALVVPLLAACGGGGSDAPSAMPNAASSADGSCGIGNFSQAMLGAVNAARAQARSCGGTAHGATHALAWSGTLAQAANVHSSDMANNNFFSHTGSNGSSADARMRAAGFKGKRTAENIAAGQAGLQASVQQLLDSPSHCTTIMSARLTQIGAACASNGGSTYKSYWTLDFGG
jgi:uncharacterized protein YkwD